MTFTHRGGGGGGGGGGVYGLNPLILSEIGLLANFLGARGLTSSQALYKYIEVF